MKIHKLTAKMLTKLPDGQYADGNGLFLRVRTTQHGTSRTWLYLRIVLTKRFQVSLGPISCLSLDAARKLVLRINEALFEGIHPKTFLQSLLPSQEEEKKPCLNDIFDQAIRDIARLKRWRNPGVERSWRSTMRRYVLPLIGDIPLDKITLEDVLKIVKPIWETKLATGVRLLNRLENLLDWADVHGYRTGENPARWNGKISMILPPPNKVRRTQHYKAISIEDLPVLCEKLWSDPTQSNLAVLLGILTATRTHEFRKAKWKEFDFENRIWSIPPERRKDNKPFPHRIPLSNEVISLLDKLPRRTRNVFPGKHGYGTMMDRKTPLTALKNTGYDVTMHGMRSTFRDWAAITHQDWIASEIALSHSISNNVTKSTVTETYLRTDMLEERREIMQKWADHCFKLINK